MQVDFYPRDYDAHSESLLLFFNGWGCDVAMFSHLQKSDKSDVIIISDYRDMSLTKESLSQINRYQTINLVAWSFGAWVAAFICLKYGITPKKGIAYNASLFPIDDNRGIPLNIAEGTLKYLSPNNIKKFRLRMMGGRKELSLLDKSSHSRRNFDDLHEELSILYQAFEQPISADFSDVIKLFQQVVIGQEDLVIPASAQRNAWQGTPVKITEIAASHFCFFDYDSWDDLVLC